MRVKVEYRKIVAETPKAALFRLMDKSEVWLPHSLTEHCRGKAVIIPRWLADQHQIAYKPLYHRPEKIEPQYDQEPLNDLRFDPQGDNNE